MEAPRVKFLTDRIGNLGKLNMYPGVKSVIVRYNTTIASSASVITFFITAALKGLLVID